MSSVQRLAGKVAVITGAGSGMGREAAMEFLRQGADVVISDINGVALRGAVDCGREISRSIIGVEADMTSEPDCRRLIDETMETFGKIDVLFNNLGVNLPAVLHETSLEQWEKVFGVNVTGMYLTCKYTLPVMMAQRDGVIINTSSGGGEAALPGLAAYSASKGAVIALTRSIAADYAAYNIRCNYLVPGVIMTEMTKKVISEQKNPAAYEENMRTNNPLLRFGTEIEIAKAAVFLASGETGFMTGASLVVDGGYLAQ